MKPAIVSRRKPVQRRSQQTVESILDAVIRILKREGIDAITTNRIAEVAGVSIGSLYQYFPDKNAIFLALHRRHVEQIDRVIQGALFDHAASSLAEMIAGLIDAMIDAHLADPELDRLLSTRVPQRGDGTRAFGDRLHGVFRLGLAARIGELGKDRDLDTAAFIVANMVDALCHGAVLRRPSALTLAEAKAEATHAVLAYLRS